MTTAAPALTTIPATFTRAEIATILGVPESRVRDWSAAKCRAIEPTSYDPDRTARYSREALVLGAFLLILQECFGLQSPVPMAVLGVIKARAVTEFADAVRNDATIDPVSVGIVRNGVEVRMKICDDQICRRLRQRIVERIVEPSNGRERDEDLQARRAPRRLEESAPVLHGLVLRGAPHVARP